MVNTNHNVKFYSGDTVSMVGSVDLFSVPEFVNYVQSASDRLYYNDQPRTGSENKDNETQS